MGLTGDMKHFCLVNQVLGIVLRFVKVV